MGKCRNKQYEDLCYVFLFPLSVGRGRRQTIFCLDFQTFSQKSSPKGSKVSSQTIICFSLEEMDTELPVFRIIRAVHDQKIIKTEEKKSWLNV